MRATSAALVLTTLVVPTGSLSLSPSPITEPTAAADRRASAKPIRDRTNIGTLSVPHIGLGTIAWSPDGPEDESRYAEVAATAMNAGLDLFDTAERYGAKGTDLIPAALAAMGVPLRGLPVGHDGSGEYLGGDTESRLGTWAQGGTIMTKFAPTPWRGDAKAVVDACRGSATRLGGGSVDLMQVHMPDIIQPFARFGVENRREEAHWDGLAECYHSGLAKNVGVSNYGPTLLERAHEHLAKRGVPLASNQIHFNLLYRRQGSLATVAKGKELGVATLAYYPLAMGLLTGKLTGASLRHKKDLRSRELLRYLEGGESPSGPFAFPNTAGTIPKGGISTLLLVLEEVAAVNQKTSAQVALNWVICKGAVPIPGASNPQQVLDNAGALGWRLSEEEVAMLDSAADALDWEFNGCGFQTADSKFVGYGFEKWRLD